MSGLKVDILGYSGPGLKNGFQIRNQHRRINSLSFWVHDWVKYVDLQTSLCFYLKDKIKGHNNKENKSK